VLLDQVRISTKSRLKQRMMQKPNKSKKGKADNKNKKETPCLELSTHCNTKGGVSVIDKL